MRKLYSDYRRERSKRKAESSLSMYDVIVRERSYFRTTTRSRDRITKKVFDENGYCPLRKSQGCELFKKLWTTSNLPAKTFRRDLFEKKRSVGAQRDLYTRKQGSFSDWEGSEEDCRDLVSATGKREAKRKEWSDGRKRQGGKRTEEQVSDFVAFSRKTKAAAEYVNEAARFDTHKREGDGGRTGGDCVIFNYWKEPRLLPVLLFSLRLAFANTERSYYVCKYPCVRARFPVVGMRVFTSHRLVRAVIR